MSEGITANQLEPGVVSVFSFETILTDAQIKAAPTTPPTVVAGEEGSIIVPIGILVVKEFAADYQPAMGDSFLYFAFALAGSVMFDTVATQQFMGSGQRRFIFGGMGARVPDQSGALAGFLEAGNFEGGDGADLQLQITTDLGENLTAGNAANKLTVSTAFMRR